MGGAINCCQNEGEENKLLGLVNEGKEIIAEPTKNRNIIGTNHENSLNNLNNDTSNGLIVIDPNNQYFNGPFDKKEYPGLLELTVVNSSTLPYGTKIQIGVNGLIKDSLRKSKDGITYFGFTDDLDNNNLDPKNAIDFLLPQKHNEKCGRYFQIMYNENMCQYLLKDLGNGLGAFVKVKDFFIISNNSMVNIGDSYLVFYFGEVFDSNYTNKESCSTIGGLGHKLKVKLFDKNRKDEFKEFEFGEQSHFIRVGRKKHGNDIELEDPLVSKVNSIIKYNNKFGWIIQDGSETVTTNGEIKITESTNGTWFLAMEHTPIYDGLIFKINFTLFNCRFIK